MAHPEDFDDADPTALAATDFLWLRSTGLPVGQRDKRLSFTALLRALFASTTNTAARAATGQITAVATLDFPSIASQAKADLTIVVNGAAVGDAVFLGLPVAPAAGLVFNAFVSAANTVTVRASNTSSGSVDAAAAVYRAVVFRSN